eukprot:13642547-Alexandrium_andersonii.AAC.1
MRHELDRVVKKAHRGCRLPPGRCAQLPEWHRQLAPTWGPAEQATRPQAFQSSGQGGLWHSEAEE